MVSGSILAFCLLCWLRGLRLHFLACMLSLYVFLRRLRKILRRPKTLRALAGNRA